MKTIKKIFKILAEMIVGLILFIIVALLWINVKPVVTAKKEIKDISKYAKAVDELKIDSKVQVIGLGEATHGNKEFQELKLTVLQNLVEKHQVGAFALEMDMAEGEAIDDYISGKSSLAIDEVMDQIAFELYHTKDIRELIEWMKDYNEEHQSDMLHFYGFDMQDSRNDIFEALAKKNDMVTYAKLRDQMMAERVEELAALEQGRNKRLMIAGHNGHIGYDGSYVKTMGAYLKENLGKAYFTIGTDYYKTKVSIASANGRKVHTFLSADILAYQAKKQGTYYLNFKDVKKSSDTYQYTHDKIHMGSNGENFSVLNYINSKTVRIHMAPDTVYDGMIFVYHATPSEYE